MKQKKSESDVIKQNCVHLRNWQEPATRTGHNSAMMPHHSPQGYTGYGSLPSQAWGCRLSQVRK